MRCSCLSLPGCWDYRCDPQALLPRGLHCLLQGTLQSLNPCDPGLPSRTQLPISGPGESDGKAVLEAKPHAGHLSVCVPSAPSWLFPLFLFVPILFVPALLVPGKAGRWLWGALASPLPTVQPKQPVVRVTTVSHLRDFPWSTHPVPVLSWPAAWLLYHPCPQPELGSCRGSTVKLKDQGGG